MRRIATVAITTGALAAGLLASAGAASADQGFAQSHKLPTATSGVQAAGAKYFVTKNGWAAIKADGYYARSGKGVKVKFWLADGKRNGWSPAVQFATKITAPARVSHIYYMTYKGLPADMEFKRLYGTYSLSNAPHLYVREAGVYVKNTHKVAFGPWKKLY
ncbi:hypothetical protein DZF91_17055 [Actinomadura logoneensis]|uniref:Uncharacterized protein n=1 Tax=Actinomadura logoneensis TaxID=2293572 RepID=A0A372JK94_9ACTN|nr:hypothetical protein [Actinomadura logoneensis]RFU40453.1 hypothetical protein DZF91_17055 [Actinomadura logoneensis]